MTDHDALMKAILTDPDDNLPRHALADHLEETGEVLRAEFIRLQIALWDAARGCHCGRKDNGHPATVGRHHNGPCDTKVLIWEVGGRAVHATHRLEGLYNRLLPSTSIAEVFGLYNWEEDGGTHADCDFGWAWGRGFVHTLTCPLAAWLKHGREAVLVHPIEQVTFPGVVRDGMIFCGDNPGQIPHGLWTELRLDHSPFLCARGDRRGLHLHFTDVHRHGDMKTATAFLSRLLLDRARGHAGLPELPQIV